MRFAAVVFVIGSTIGVLSPVAAAPPDVAASAAAAKSPARRPARMSDEAELAQVVSLYEAGKYAQCAEALSKHLDKNAEERLRDADVIANARIYQAACLIGSGRSDEADAPLRAAILADPQMKPPDSLVFPPPVVERFLRVRETLHEAIRRSELGRVEVARREADERALKEKAKDARVRALEELATREVVTVRNRRWIAVIPFGAGQFQNGKSELGWALLTSEVALGATALTALAMQTHFTLEAHRLKNPSNNAVLETWNTLLDVSAWGFIGVAALGILEAQLSFVPERREIRRRPIPPELRRKESAGVRVKPTLRANERSLALGISGVF
jgi:hypothetical protein